MGLPKDEAKYDIESIQNQALKELTSPLDNYQHIVDLTTIKYFIEEGHLYMSGMIEDSPTENA